MTKHDLDEDLRAQFSALRAEDKRLTPPFAEMLARSVRAPGATREVGFWRRRRTWAVAGPLLAAASFAAVWLLPRRNADREFERVVAEWSRVSQVASPTDKLLSVPGAELLGLPALSVGAQAPRR